MKCRYCGKEMDGDEYPNALVAHEACAMEATTAIREELKRKREGCDDAEWLDHVKPTN